MNIEIITVIMGFITSIILVGVSIFTLNQSNKIQRQNILHDLIKTEKTLLEDLWEIGTKKAIIQSILNFYEYTSFLYFKGFINKSMTKKWFKSGLIESYKKFEGFISPGFENLIKLYDKWKNE